MEPARDTWAQDSAAGNSHAEALVWDRACRAQWQFPPGTARQPDRAQLTQLAGGVRGVGRHPVAGELGSILALPWGAREATGLSSGVFVVNCALAPACHRPPPREVRPLSASGPQARQGGPGATAWPGPGGAGGAGWWGALADRPLCRVPPLWTAEAPLAVRRGRAQEPPCGEASLVTSRKPWSGVRGTVTAGMGPDGEAALLARRRHHRLRGTTPAPRTPHRGAFPGPGTRRWEGPPLQRRLRLGGRLALSGHGWSGPTAAPRRLPGPLDEHRAPL